MSLISVALVVILVGVLLWTVEQFVPMAPPLKTLLKAVVVIVVVIWLLQALGLLPLLRDVRIR